MNQPRTLLIGGGGYTGEYLAKELESIGRSVSIIGRGELNKPHLSHFTYYQGDFGDVSFIEPLLESHDEVIHLAYATVPNTSFENPLADLQENLTPSVQLFLRTAQLGKKLLLVSSGGTIYGEQTTKKIKEEHPKHPISPYGLTKLTLENYAYLYGVTHNLNYCVVRPGNAYGLNQPPFRGQGFIATAVASASMNKKIKIFGASGSVRDYIYVTDVASAIVQVLLKGRRSEAYNIGSGVGLNNMDIVHKINNILLEKKVALEYEHVEQRPFDVRSNVLDVSKIYNHTGWKPVVPIESGLEMVVEEFFEPKN